MPYVGAGQQVMRCAHIRYENNKFRKNAALQYLLNCLLALQQAVPGPGSLNLIQILRRLYVVHHTL
jgi:hypothetical protein